MQTRPPGGKKNIKDSAKVSIVVPAIVELFQCNDRATRVALLQRVDKIAPILDEGTVNSTVFELLLTGFSDTTVVLRELTIPSFHAVCVQAQ